MFIRDDACISTRLIEWPPEADFFDVVGEQYHEGTIARIKEQIRSTAEGTGGGVSDFLPPSVILLEDDFNQHDADAVAVLYPFSKSALQGSHDGYDAETIGYLPREQAKGFRMAMNRFGISGRPLEVLGCVVTLSTASRDNVKLYLPRTFIQLCERGYADERGNKPDWLTATSPVPIREHKHMRDASTYTDDDLRRIYCRYAKMKAWNSLPYMVEEKVASWSRRIGPVGLAIAYHHTGVDEAIDR